MEQEPVKSERRRSLFAVTDEDQIEQFKKEIDDQIQQTVQKLASLKKQFKTQEKELLNKTFDESLLSEEDRNFHESVDNFIIDAREKLSIAKTLKEIAVKNQQKQLQRAQNRLHYIQQYIMEQTETRKMKV